MYKGWLLCDFHIHTTLSDGIVPIREVVDLFGREGFDVISISDHVLDEASRARCANSSEPSWSIPRERFPDYMRTLWSEARRAWEKYELLVIPGMEITNDTDGYHVLAVDIKEYIDPALPVEELVETIHNQGGIAIAPHPHRGSEADRKHSMYLWEHHDEFAKLFDAWEVANRDDLFNVVGLKKFNYVANSDFHEHRHLYSWKTLLPCEKNAESVKAAIRYNRRVSICLFR